MSDIDHLIDLIMEHLYNDIFSNKCNLVVRKHSSVTNKILSFSIFNKYNKSTVNYCEYEITINIDDVKIEMKYPRLSYYEELTNTKINRLIIECKNGNFIFEAKREIL
jgi:hypothetical protein